MQGDLGFIFNPLRKLLPHLPPQVDFSEYLRYKLVGVLLVVRVVLGIVDLCHKVFARAMDYFALETEFLHCFSDGVGIVL